MHSFIFSLLQNFFLRVNPGRINSPVFLGILTSSSILINDLKYLLSQDFFAQVKDFLIFRVLIIYNERSFKIRKGLSSPR